MKKRPAKPATPSNVVFPFFPSKKPAKTPKRYIDPDRPNTVIGMCAMSQREFDELNLDAIAHGEDHHTIALGRILRNYLKRNRRR